VFSFQISAVYTHNSLVSFRTAILLSNCMFTDQNLDPTAYTSGWRWGLQNSRLRQRRCSGFRSFWLSRYVFGWRVSSFRRIVMPSSLGPSSPRRISGAFKILGILLTPSQHNNPISTNYIESTTYSHPSGLSSGSTFQSQTVTVRESGTVVSLPTILRVISGLRREVDENLRSSGNLSSV